ncbi:MAG: efflux RND transporter permease subunit [Candidatus Cloacimonetes bacterium]|nr:efflux RND transporter permease subunit [Candidatus Cloacimonadota bacterium]
MKIIKLSIERPVTVLMIYLLIAITGVISFLRLPIDFLPEIGYPQLTIITICQNSSPNEIESQISQPIEEIVSTIKGVRKVTSISRNDVSVVTLKFNWGTDMSYASLNLREKLDNIRYLLPENADRPNIVHLDPSEDPIMYIALTAKTSNLIQIQDISENFIKRKLQQLDGVAAADIIGDQEREIKIIFDEQKIDALNLSIEQIKNKIKYSNYSISGGVIKDGQYRYNVKIVGEFTNTEDIKKTVISSSETGKNIFLKDIAEVTFSYKDKKSITRINKNPSLGMLIRKEANTNTVRVCKTIRNEIDNLKSEYSDVGFEIVVDQSVFIKESIFSVLEAILIGGLLAFIILFLFLNNLKSPIHISIVMPISILTTFILLYFNKISLNIISLSGLALGVGMLVDNSIVVSENIFRHQKAGLSWKEAAYSGTKEVGMVITASTLTTLAVFLPILYVKGIASALFRQQALTVTFSLLSSLFVSLTMLPLLSSLHFKRKPKRLRKKIFRILFIIAKIVFFPITMLYYILKFVFGFFSKFIKFFSQRFQKKFDVFSIIYLNFLGKCLNHKKTTLLVFVILFVISIFVLFSLDQQFFPDVEQNEFTIQFKTEAGTPLKKTDEMIKLIEQKLSDDNRIEKYFTSVGKSTEDRLSYYLEKASSENLAEIKIIIIDEYNSNEIIADYQEIFKSFPSVIRFERGSNLFTSFLEFEEPGLIIAFEGNNLEKMRNKAKNIKEQLFSNDIFSNVHTDFESLLPMIRLQIDRDMVALYNISVDEITRFIRTNVSGEKVSEFRQFDNTIDITLETGSDLNLSQLINRNLIVNGQKIPLRSVLKVSFDRTQEEIKRIDQNRRISIYFSYSGKLSKAIEEIDKIISNNQNEEFRISLEGVNKEINQSLKSLIYALVFAILLVYMILASQFESLKLPFIVMFVAPMGVIGVSFALFFTNSSISIMSTLGMIVLSGIIVNDAILLVDLINQLRNKGIETIESITQAAQARLRPILMTTFTTVFGLLPLALGVGSGAELQSAMAIAVIGGILTSTFLTLVFIPILFYVFERR